MYAELVNVVSKAACLYPEKEPESDLVNPDAMYTNIAKFVFADFFHEATKLCQDIGGGILTTAPNYRDWANPEIRKWLEKYLSAREGVPTEHRLQAIRLMKDLSFSHANTYIHGEGSLAAQRIAMFEGADWQRYKAAAQRAARIPGWEKDPVFGAYPDWPSCISQIPPMDKSYKL